ncbi:MAG: polyprenyl synthetase family protein [Terriglobales bacterium]
MVPSGKANWQQRERAEVERHLERAVPAASVPPRRLHQAMRHSLLGSGKRLRPLLCRAAARAVRGGNCAAAWRPAIAVELVHTYSLIHDDLPALDDDQLRRGRPTCHVSYGEAMAILAGDALLTRAFGLLAAAPRAAEMVALLADAAGTPAGMVAGQVEDLAADARAGLAQVRRIHQRKTAALLRASVVLGGWAADATEPQRRQLGRFGAALGLAFQIADDLLDARSNSVELGKTAGKDAAQDKATWVAAAGADHAQAAANTLVRQAVRALQAWGPAADHLRELAEFVVQRRR